MGGNDREDVLRGGVETWDGNRASNEEINGVKTRMKDMVNDERKVHEIDEMR